MSASEGSDCGDASAESVDRSGDSTMRLAGRLSRSVVSRTTPVSLARQLGRRRLGVVLAVRGGEDVRQPEQRHHHHRRGDEQTGPFGGREGARCRFRSQVANSQQPMMTSNVPRPSATGVSNGLRINANRDGATYAAPRRHANPPTTTRPTQDTD